jgi:hypothetical protein
VEGEGKWAALLRRKRASEGVGGGASAKEVLVCGRSGLLGERAERAQRKAASCAAETGSLKEVLVCCGRSGLLRSRAVRGRPPEPPLRPARSAKKVAGSFALLFCVVVPPLLPLLPLTPLLHPPHAPPFPPTNPPLPPTQIISKVGYDALIFLRFHRMAARILLQISVYSFLVLLPTNYFGYEHNNDEFGEAVVFSDFSRFTTANIAEGSPMFWLHLVAVYLLTFIVIRELLAEYTENNAIHHRFLMSKDLHLRTVLVTDIPRDMRSEAMLHDYFDRVYK